MAIILPNNTYPVNSTLRFTGNFYNINGQLGDPTSVIVWVGSPNGTVYQYNPTRDSTGQYHLDFLTATPGGQWWYRYQGLGTLATQSPDTPFTIQFPKF